jgi:hypothetical protein
MKQVIHRVIFALLLASLACSCPATLDAAPINDDFAAAVDLGAVQVITTTSTMAGSTVQPEEGLATGSGSIWWRWTAPSEGTLGLVGHLDSADANLRFQLWRGTSLTALTALGGTNRRGSWGQTEAVTAGQTYYLQFRSTAPKNSPVTINLNFCPLLANDAFANAIDLGDPATVRWHGPLQGSTLEPGEPVTEFSSFPSTGSIWLKWRAPASGSAICSLLRGGTHAQRVSGRDSYPIPQATVYTGTSLGSLTPLADDADPDFSCVAGQTYFVGIERRDGPGQAGFPNVSLQIRTGPAAQANTTPDTAMALGTAASREVTGHTWGSPADGVWHSWKAPSAGILEVEISGADAPAWMRLLYPGEPDVIAESSGMVRLKVSAGQDLFIGVRAEEKGPFTLTLNHTTGSPPANDSYGAAFAITGLGSPVNGNSTHASVEDTDPVFGANTVWYRWTAATSGSVLYQVSPSTDFRVKVFQRIGGEFISEDAVGQVFPAVAGTQYYFAVSDNDAGGPHQLTLSSADPPNDDFQNAIDLGGVSRTAVAVAIAGATLQNGSGETRFRGTGSVWFTWTAPATGPLTLAAMGTFRTTYVTVHTGTALNALSEVTPTRTNTVSVEVPVTSGTRYFLRVGVVYPDMPFDLHLSTAGLGSPYDFWLLKYPSLTGLSAARTADPDQDGIPNLVEAGLGFHPLRPNAHLDVTTTSGAAVFDFSNIPPDVNSFLPSPSQTGTGGTAPLRAFPQFSTDLIHWRRLGFEQLPFRPAPGTPGWMRLEVSE